MSGPNSNLTDTIFGLEGVKIVLADINPVLCEEWRVQFSEEIADGIVEVYCGNIFDCQKTSISARGTACRVTPNGQDLGVTALVSPGNSFGFMDGGIEMAYSRVFGKEVEKRVQERILDVFYGEMPVGHSVMVETGHESLHYLISAPTMRVPLDARSTVAAYLAFRAVLIAVREHNLELSLFQNLVLSLDVAPLDEFESESKPKSQPLVARILCPGLGTGVGRMPPDRCSYQMKEAYLAVVGGFVSETVESKMNQGIDSVEPQSLRSRTSSATSCDAGAGARRMVSRPPIDGIHVISDSPIPPGGGPKRSNSPSNIHQRVEMIQEFESKTSHWAQHKEKGNSAIGKAPRVLSGGEQSITSHTSSYFSPSISSMDALPLQQTGFANVGDAVKQHYWMRKYVRDQE